MSSESEKDLLELRDSLGLSEASKRKFNPPEGYEPSVGEIWYAKLPGALPGILTEVLLLRITKNVIVLSVRVDGVLKSAEYAYERRSITLIEKREKR